MLKTNKSLKKRIKISKNGKMKTSKPGRGHFNAKARRSKQLSQRTLQNFTMTNKDKNRFLPND